MSSRFVPSSHVSDAKKIQDADEKLEKEDKEEHHEVHRAIISGIGNGDMKNAEQSHWKKLADSLESFVRGPVPTHK